VTLLPVGLPADGKSLETSDNPSVRSTQGFTSDPIQATKFRLRSVAGSDPSHRGTDARRSVARCLFGGTPIDGLPDIREQLRLESSRI
jgi:hypothetical protein